MNATWGLLTVLSLVCHTEPRCSPTSYYKNCWIRRFPGLFIDIEESQRRGAQLLKQYQEDTALKCSRTCCLTRNFSCNLAIFHYDSTQENCFHLHCPTLESCILSHKGNVVLYNITKGVDPDLLVFGKYFTSNVRVLPHHYGRVNASEPLPSDKRQFIHPPPPAVPPLTAAPSSKLPSTVSKVHTATAATPTIEPHSSTQPAATTRATTVSSSTERTPSTSRVSPISTSTVATTFTAPPSSTTTTTTTTTPTVVLHHADTLSTTTSPPSTSTTTLHHTTFPEPSSTPPVSTTLSSSMASTQKSPDATEGSLGRNHTAGSHGADGVDAADPTEGVGPGWHVAANTLLVAVAVFVTVLLSCCCSVLLVVSWRGQRKQMGCYRTSGRGKKGSMRLIKYVLVRESS